METIYKDFFRELLEHQENLTDYVNELYAGDKYLDEDLNFIFGVLQDEKLLVCRYSDDVANVDSITFKGKHYFDSEQEVNNTKPRMIELIDKTEDIKKNFHELEDLGNLSVIYDNSEFITWQQNLQYELQELLKTHDDQLLKKTLEILSEKFGGYNDEIDFAALEANLNIIKANQNKYFTNKEVKELEAGAMDILEIEKKPLVFISHSSENKEQVQLIAELLKTIGLVPGRDIFCSSLPGYDIPLDNNIFVFLRNKFLNNTLHMIFIHSHEYYNSPVSLNEMGAAWVLKTAATSILLPGFSFEEMNGVVNNQTISIKLDNDETEVRDKLNQLRGKLENEFKINCKDAVWNNARDEFIKHINNSEFVAMVL